MVHCFQNIWFDNRTHSNEQRNGHQLSTKWELGSDQSSVSCLRQRGVLVGAVH